MFQYGGTVPGHVAEVAVSTPDAGATRGADEAAMTVTSPRSPAEERRTEVRFNYSARFPRVLAETGCSLLVSTYQAGQLVAVGTAGEELVFSFRAFDRAMGLAVGADRIAVAGKGQIWSLRDHSRTRHRDRARWHLRQVLAATLIDRHRRDPVPRDRVGDHRQR